MRLSVIIPVYNEAKTLRELIRRVAAVGIAQEIILVDDGSTDGTRQTLHQLQQENGKVLRSESDNPCELRVVLHERNRGKGAAVRTGFQATSGDIVVIQDADLEYDPHDFPALIAPIERGEADAVLGGEVGQLVTVVGPGTDGAAVSGLPACGASGKGEQRA